jgi:hypothetical protein
MKVSSQASAVTPLRAIMRALSDTAPGTEPVGTLP